MFILQFKNHHWINSILSMTQLYRIRHGYNWNQIPCLFPIDILHVIWTCLDIIEISMDSHYPFVYLQFERIIRPRSKPINHQIKQKFWKCLYPIWIVHQSSRPTHHLPSCRSIAKWKSMNSIECHHSTMIDSVRAKTPNVNKTLEISLLQRNNWVKFQ